MFRGVLDVRARRITPAMARAAALEIAAVARERGLAEEAILPRMDDLELVPRVAAATALAAQAEGLARVARTREELVEGARRAVGATRAATDALMQAGLIAPVPPGR